MAKKIKKTIHRIVTAKLSELFKSDKKSSLDDLKNKLSGVDKKDFKKFKNTKGK